MTAEGGFCKHGALHEMARPKKTTVCPLAGSGVGGQQKTLIWFHLLGGPKRFGELQRLLPQASRQMLTLQLRDLENLGVLDRTIYAQQPPKVEYALTDLGQSSETMLRQFVAWGEWFCGQANLEYEDWLTSMASRWNMWIWYCLLDGSKRFSELQRLLPEISRQTLSRQLRELKRLGVLQRWEATSGEFKVEYALTDLGQRSAPMIRRIFSWGRWYCDQANLPFEWPLSALADDHTSFNAVAPDASSRRAIG